MVSKSLSLSAAGLALALGALGATSAQAECKFLIEPVRDQWMVQFDPFASNSAGAQFDVAVTNMGDTACEGQLQAELRGEQFGLSQGASGERVYYSLVDQRAGSDLTPISGVSSPKANGRSLALAPGERSLERLSFVFDGDKLVNSGVYSQSVFLSVDEPGVGVSSEKSVTLAVEVPRTAVMGLTGQFSRARGVPVIDLGELSEGAKPLQTQIFVMSTGGYTLAVTSDNNGRLRLDSTDWYVDYELALGEQPIDLVNGGQIEVASTRSQTASYPMRIHVGSVGSKRAGQYSDVLRFTVTAI